MTSVMGCSQALDIVVFVELRFASSQRENIGVRTPRRSGVGGVVPVFLEFGFRIRLGSEKPRRQSHFQQIVALEFGAVRTLPRGFVFGFMPFRIRPWRQ